MRGRAVIHGSCLCGGVRLELSRLPLRLLACHCRTCQKFYGSAFGAIAVVAKQAFRYVAGESLIRRFRTSARVERTFCGSCGSPLPIVEPWDPLVGVPLALLDSELSMSLDAHIFVSERASWFNFSDGVTGHDYWPPGATGDERFRQLEQRGVSLDPWADDGGN